jgi:hypothetical protein
MAISEAYQNTQSVTTTEHSLPNDATYNSTNVITTDGVYQVFLDLNALAAGDIFEFRMYEKISSGGTVRLSFVCRFAGVQGTPMWASPSFILLHGWDFTIKKISGTDRTIDWSIRKVA